MTDQSMDEGLRAVVSEMETLCLGVAVGGRWGEDTQYVSVERAKLEALLSALRQRDEALVRVRRFVGACVAVGELTPNDSAENPCDLVDAIDAILGTEAEACPVCAVPFRPDDLCAADIDLGTCHARCLEGSTVVDLETGEEKPDGKIGTYRYATLTGSETQ